MCQLCNSNSMYLRLFTSKACHVYSTAEENIINQLCNLANHAKLLDVADCLAAMS